MAAYLKQAFVRNAGFIVILEAAFALYLFSAVSPLLVLIGVIALSIALYQPLTLFSNGQYRPKMKKFVLILGIITALLSYYLLWYGHAAVLFMVIYPIVIVLIGALQEPATLPKYRWEPKAGA